MKKITFLAILLFALSSVGVFASAIDGGYNTPDDGGSLTVGSTSTAVVKLSKNVLLGYQGETDGLGYAVGTYHTSGTKSFGTSSGDSKIWSIDGTAATIPDAPSGTDSADFGDWAAL